MMDIDTPRDEATGQFAGETSERKFGRAAELEASGWKELPKQQESELDVAGAAEELSDKGAEEPEPAKVDLFDPDALAQGELKHATDLEDPNAIKTALTPEEASAALTQWRQAETDIAQVESDDALLRELGIDPAPDMSATPDAVQEQAEPAPQEQPASAQEQALQWLQDHPEAHRALSEHVQQSTAAAEQARQAYSQQLDGALAVARQVTFQAVPELRGVTDEGHARSVLSAIAQQNPARFEQIRQLDTYTAQLMQAQAAERQAQSQRELQAVRTYNDEASRAYEAKYGAVSREIGDQVASYLREHGATHEDFTALQQSRLPVWAQKALIDAAAYHKLMSTPVPKPSRQPLPPVQRPGAAQPRGAVRGANDLRSLNARLSSTGSIQDAMELLSAQRAARG
ncbi:hypothetical protein [Bradyrhizobium sp. ORS 86]|uniref:hypothetical protein n=1 Tax=Bradyrhizobium sp. ORS 86 TaxID=1685970 RepID=UPI0038904645